MEMQVKSAPPIVEHQVEHLVPGMELARDIYSEDGRTLVCKGALISQEIIANLKKWCVPKVFTIAQTTLSPITDPKLQQFVKKYSNSVEVVQKAFTDIREANEIPIEAFTATAAEITNNVFEEDNVIDQLYRLPPCDDYTFHHCVNVSVIAALIAVWLKYPRDIVDSIALAGLLHDVGKAQLPPQLLQKTSKLSADEYRHYQQHVIFGGELARKLPNVAESIIAGILEHHERADGTGYPHGLTAEQIHPYARIVAVADLYDERLTISRGSDIVLTPYVSLEMLRDEAYKLDAKACITFTSNMINFVPGNNVALTDGKQGMVVFLNERFPSRCMVQLEDGTVLDLAEDPYVRIHHMIR